MSDEEVWTGLIQGKRESLRILYDRYFETLYSYGLKMSGSISAAEDAIHELFLDIWKYREGLSSTSSIKFYLFRALRRKIYKTKINDDRSLKFDPKAVIFDDVVEDSVERSLIDEELHSETIARFQASLKELPDRQQESILLRFYGDLSYGEIADVLEVNEQSARNLVNRGLHYLRKQLQASIMLVLWLFLNGT